MSYPANRKSCIARSLQLFSSLLISSMATSVSASPISITLLPTRNTDKFTARVLHNSRSRCRFFKLRCTLSNNSYNAQKFSPPRDYSTFSAVSSSSDTESTTMSDDTTNPLDRVTVLDLNGNEIPLSDIWKERKAVVAFARHFGCVFCRKRADYLASKKDVMDASSVALVLIGPGNIDQARAFSEQTKFPGEVYADPTHLSYEALKFVSGVSTTFTPKSGLKIMQLYMEGYRQDWKLSFQKDTVTRGGWQQGGILVAGPGKNNISYIHKDKEAGDEPDIQDILKACCY